MTTTDQTINLPSPTDTTGAAGYGLKFYGLTFLFMTWIAYSAYALGSAIVEAPHGLQCTNHIQPN